MNGCTPAPHETIVSRVVVRPVEIDELSTVRYIHANALRSQSTSNLTEPEIDAFVAHVYSGDYTSKIADLVRSCRLFGAELDGDLIATAGWAPANDSGATARLLAIFVAPMFTKVGVGRLLLRAIEENAERAGFHIFALRTPVGSAGFFHQSGYEPTSHGTWQVQPGCAIPVAFLRKQTKDLVGKGIVKDGLPERL